MRENKIFWKNDSINGRDNNDNNKEKKRFIISSEDNS